MEALSMNRSAAKNSNTSMNHRHEILRRPKKAWLELKSISIETPINITKRTRSFCYSKQLLNPFTTVGRCFPTIRAFLPPCCQCFIVDFFFLICPNFHLIQTETGDLLCACLIFFLLKFECECLWGEVIKKNEKTRYNNEIGERDGKHRPVVKGLVTK